MALPEHVEPTDVALDDPVVHTSALRLTLASPLYRGATIALFLSGLGFSAAAPADRVVPGQRPRCVTDRSVLGIFAALGIIVAQNLLPTAVATTSAIFLSAAALSSALGGAAGGVGAAVIGLPLVFLIRAVLALLAVIGLAVMTRSAGRNL